MINIYYMENIIIKDSYIFFNTLINFYNYDKIFLYSSYYILYKDLINFYFCKLSKDNYSQLKSIYNLPQSIINYAIFVSKDEFIIYSMTNVVNFFHKDILYYCIIKGDYIYFHKVIDDSYQDFKKFCKSYEILNKL